MKISASQIRELAKVYEAQLRARAAGGSGTLEKPDRVDLSPDAQILQAVARAAKEAKRVREDQVAELRAKIARGEYHVSAHDIADQMLKRIKADRMLSGRGT